MTCDRLPTAPLLAALAARARRTDTSTDELALLLRIDRRVLQRLHHRPTVGYALADRLAVALGRHPSEIWPEWFDAASSRRAGG